MLTALVEQSSNRLETALLGAGGAFLVLAARSLVHGPAQRVLSGSVAASGLDAPVDATDLRELVRRNDRPALPHPSDPTTEGARS